MRQKRHRNRIDDIDSMKNSLYTDYHSYLYLIVNGQWSGFKEILSVETDFLNQLLESPKTVYRQMNNVQDCIAPYVHNAIVQTILLLEVNSPT